ncbi:allophanate hydrolase [Haloactinospora alba]|uniref:Allophanate hydrolase n=1 Tax=Haloactinospora alba TaxID=405555 RepID=A0A543N9H2_9ACTN|nr:biotin-dependent carboxyltransferase family protein [Haloactinospora alba]TQN28460.1 allophanate hydrolase [Haloactinospora alba]
MTELLVHTGGLSTTVQDAGRDGHYAIGMPPSGAMDQYSFRVGNLLVGNSEGAAALEATYIGPRLEFTDTRLVAVTGADTPVTLNGEPADTWRALPVGPGDVLSLSPVTGGARPYVAVSGGIAVPEYLGSRSTYTLTGGGGLDGRKLADGDRLPLGATEVPPASGRPVPEELRPGFPEVTEARTVVGLCSYRFTHGALKSFLGEPWKVTKDADRIGYRMSGWSLDFVPREQPHGAGSGPANVVDLGYPVGSIQVPGGDEPIVLLNDAVTGGGYATIGTVVSVDRDRMAQTKTGDQVSFVSVGLEDALEARRERGERLARVRELLTA